MKVRAICLGILAVATGFAAVRGLEMPTLASGPEAEAAVTVADPSEGKFAFLVGINDYQRTDILPKLKGAVSDVEAMARLLKSPGFDFAETNVEVLKDKDATGPNIIAGFIRLIEKAKAYRAETCAAGSCKDATVYFQYSGHGSRVKLAPGQKTQQEPDGYDESIVPVNSRDKEGKNFDVIDDDLHALFTEMAKHTGNALYVFDSCHSGTVDRGEAGREADTDLRKQPETQLPAGFPRPSTPESDGGDTELAKGNDRYVMIAGSRSNEKSYEKALVCDPKDKTSGCVPTRGTLTYYLERELKKLPPLTTYRDMMARVAFQVSFDNPTQHPQISGNSRKRVLDGTVQGDDSLIPVVEVVENGYEVKTEKILNPGPTPTPTPIRKDLIKIGAGNMAGVQVGNLVVFRNKEKENLGEGTVTKVVDSNISEVVFSPPYGKVISFDEKKAAKAELISPLFGDSTLEVLIDTAALPATPQKQGDIALAAVAAEIKKQMPAQGVGLLSLVSHQSSKPYTSTNPNWVRVKRDRFYHAFCNDKPKSTCDISNLIPAKDADENILVAPNDNEPIFYIEGRDGMPVMGWFVLESNTEAKAKIVNALQRYARQKNLLSIDTSKTGLASKIQVELVMVEGEINNEGKFERTEEVPIPVEARGVVKSRVGMIYGIRVENRLNQRLYVTIVNISSDGAINVLYPKLTRSQEVTGAEIGPISSGLISLSAPLGMEEFRVIVTLDESDYSALGQAKPRGGLSPLDMLIDRAYDGVAGRGPLTTTTSTDRWAVISPGSIVVDPPQPTGKGLELTIVGALIHADEPQSEEQVTRSLPSATPTMAEIMAEIMRKHPDREGIKLYGQDLAIENMKKDGTLDMSKTAADYDLKSGMTLRVFANVR